MSGLLFAAGILATWRVTHLVVAEDGPWNLVTRLRVLAGPGVVGQMMDCFNCASIWLAMPFAYWLSTTWSDGVIVWLALSGGAMLLERIVGVPPSARQ
jgi:hypothetical protein